MRKQKISAPSREGTSGGTWLRIDQLADVEFTSESESHPVEAALWPREEGWRAGDPGEQTIRLIFHEPLTLRRLHIEIDERERERTQEFVVRATEVLDGPWREIVRQQFNFSPAGASREVENYKLELPAVRALEITIIPDIRGSDARASLQQLRLA